MNYIVKYISHGIERRRPAYSIEGAKKMRDQILALPGVQKATILKNTFGIRRSDGIHRN